MEYRQSEKSPASAGLFSEGRKHRVLADSPLLPALGRHSVKPGLQPMEPQQRRKFAPERPAHAPKLVVHRRICSATARPARSCRTGTRQGRAATGDHATLGLTPDMPAKTRRLQHQSDIRQQPTLLISSHARRASTAQCLPAATPE